MVSMILAELTKILLSEKENNSSLDQEFQVLYYRLGYHLRIAKVKIEKQTTLYNMVNRRILELML